MYSDQLNFQYFGNVMFLQQSADVLNDEIFKIIATDLQYHDTNRRKEINVLFVQKQLYLKIAKTFF